MDHYPIYHGQHISLGAMRREYVALAMPGLNNLRVTRGVILRPPVTLEEELTGWYDKPRPNDVLFAILLHEHDADGKTIDYRYIGHTGLHGISWPTGTAETGTIIVDEACLGKGYGKETKLLLLRDAFLVRGLRKVNSRVKSFNGNSWGHLIASGYKEIGRQRAHHFDNGMFVDSILLEIFRDEWEPIWEEYQRTKLLPRLSEEQRDHLRKETGSK